MRTLVNTKILSRGDSVELSIPSTSEQFGAEISEGGRHCAKSKVSFSAVSQQGFQLSRPKLLRGKCYESKHQKFLSRHEIAKNCSCIHRCAFVFLDNSTTQAEYENAAKQITAKAHLASFKRSRIV